MKEHNERTVGWSSQQASKKPVLRRLQRLRKTGVGRRILSCIAILLIIVMVDSPLHRAYASASVILTYQGTLSKNGIPSPWKLKEHLGNAKVRILREQGTNILHLRSEGSSFSIEHPLQLSPSEYPFIEWSWKVEKLPMAGDGRERDKNDQALQILVAFENRKIISYVWDSNAPAGTVINESVGWPFPVTIKVIVARSGSSDMDKWVLQQRNIYQDYKKLFQEEPPRFAGVRIQTNTQYTRDSAEGYVGDIIFSKAHAAMARNE